MFAHKILALAALLAFGASAAQAQSVTYDLTLNPLAGYAIGGTGTLTVSAAPSTGFNAVSNYFQTPQGGSGSMLDLTFNIGGDVFTLAQENPNSNPLAQFISGKLTDITYAGVAANGDSFMITSDFNFFIRQQNISTYGSFTATPVSTNPAPVPEPASFALIGTGLLALAGFRRRR